MKDMKDMSKQETVDEITAKMSNYTNECNDGYHTDYSVVIEDMKSFAERINEARKREVGNGAKMYEALERIANLMDSILVRTELDDEIHRIALEAQNMADGVLLLSPRNCDRFATGDLERDAQDAMMAMLDEGVAGYRSMAMYLLSPVHKEQKGEPDGSK